MKDCASRSEISNQRVGSVCLFLCPQAPRGHHGGGSVLQPGAQVQGPWRLGQVRVETLSGAAAAWWTRSCHGHLDLPKCLRNCSAARDGSAVQPVTLDHPVGTQAHGGLPFLTGTHQPSPHFYFLVFLKDIPDSLGLSPSDRLSNRRGCSQHMASGAQGRGPRD